MAHFLILLLMWAPLCARDYGTAGTTFPINEHNLLDYLRERLSCANAHELNLFYQKQRHTMQEPRALHLPEAEHRRVFFYDPTITAWQDIKDHQGTILVKKGEKYNPLDQATLTSTLLFFDATQPRHIEWAKQQAGMWILVKGQPMELEEKESCPVYFDQFGSLTTKLGIQAIPARVSQEGKFLKIEEIEL